MGRIGKQMKYLTTGAAVSALSLAAFGAVAMANADSNPYVTIDLDYVNPVSVTTDEYAFDADTMTLNLKEGYSFKLNEGPEVSRVHREQSQQRTRSGCGLDLEDVCLVLIVCRC